MTLENYSSEKPEAYSCFFTDLSLSHPHPQLHSDMFGRKGATLAVKMLLSFVLQSRLRAAIWKSGCNKSLLSVLQ